MLQSKRLRVLELLLGGLPVHIVIAYQSSSSFPNDTGYQL